MAIGHDQQAPPTTTLTTSGVIERGFGGFALILHQPQRSTSGGRRQPVQKSRKATTAKLCSMRRQPSSSWCRGPSPTSMLRRVLVAILTCVLLLPSCCSFLGLSGVRVVLGFVSLMDNSEHRTFATRSSKNTASSSFVRESGGKRCRHRRRCWAAFTRRLLFEDAATASIDGLPLSKMQLEPPERILIHWRGEGVEGYSMQFRHLEFLGAIAALSDGQFMLDQLLRGCASTYSADATAANNPIGIGSTVNNVDMLLRSNRTTHHPTLLLSFENALSYAGGRFEERVSPVKRERYEQAMQFVHVHDASLRAQMTRHLLKKAVERCSLIHAVYEVVADTSSSSVDPAGREWRYETLARNAMKRGALSDLCTGGENERAAWCLRVRQFGDPPPDDAEDDSRGDGSDMTQPRERIPQLRHAGRKTRSMQKEREALLALRPLLEQLGGEVNLRSPDAKLYVLDGLANGTTVLARRMASGGYSRALTIAPNTRICVTNTPLCPIASYVLCNVAGVGGGNQTILDPYAGSGAILLAASLIDNRSRTVGIEIAHSGLVNRDDLHQDFVTRQLPEPAALIHGDSTKVDVRRKARAAIGNVPFDLIITDPPYGIRESTIQSVPLFDLLNSIAVDRTAGVPLLAKGGKLVCFVPCQVDQTLESVLPSERLLQEAGLRYESIREQPLNSKLSRWLVSFVCYR